MFHKKWNMHFISYKWAASVMSCSSLEYAVFRQESLWDQNTKYSRGKWGRLTWTRSHSRRNKSPFYNCRLWWTSSKSLHDVSATWPHKGAAHRFPVEPLKLSNVAAVSMFQLKTESQIFFALETYSEGFKKSENHERRWTNEELLRYSCFRIT